MLWPTCLVSLITGPVPMSIRARLTIKVYLSNYVTIMVSASPVPRSRIGGLRCDAVMHAGGDEPQPRCQDLSRPAGGSGRGTWAGSGPAEPAGQRRGRLPPGLS